MSRVRPKRAIIPSPLTLREVVCSYRAHVSIAPPSLPTLVMRGRAHGCLGGGRAAQGYARSLARPLGSKEGPAEQAQADFVVDAASWDASIRASALQAMLDIDLIAAEVAWSHRYPPLVRRGGAPGRNVRAKASRNRAVLARGFGTTRQRLKSKTEDCAASSRTPAPPEPGVFQIASIQTAVSRITHAEFRSIACGKHRARRHRRRSKHPLKGIVAGRTGPVAGRGGLATGSLSLGWRC